MGKKVTAPPVSRKVIGLDLSDKTAEFCTLDEASGDVVERGKVALKSTHLAKQFEKDPGSLIVLEVGTQSGWVSCALEQAGHEVLVANARNVALIYKNSKKSDRTDAENLARLGRLDPQLLHPIRHRSKESHRHLVVLRARDVVVAARTMVINHVRGIMKTQGLRVSSCSAESFPRVVRAELVDKQLLSILGPVIDNCEQQTKTIKEYDQLVKLLCKHYSVAKKLQSVPGVGPLTAMVFLLTIEDPKRFRRSRDVGAYLGLTPRKKESGESSPQLRITKQGDKHTRKLLVCAAQYVLGRHCKDNKLREWGLKLAARGGKNAKKRAVIAVARRLAVLLHTLWKKDDVYDDRYQGQKLAKKKAS